jgi:glucose-6-phosphate 1-dehydrogenase
VPFYLRAGKCLGATTTEVLVTLKQPPTRVFDTDDPPNYLRFRLGPDRVAIALGATAKRPGAAMEGRDIELFVCNATTEEVGAYERLIGAALVSDTSLFARDDGVLEAWRIVEPLLRGHEAPHLYEPGSAGPTAADALIAPSGGWRPLDERL